MILILEKKCIFGTNTFFGLRKISTKKIRKREETLKFFWTKRKIIFLLQIIWNIEKIDFREGSNIEEGGACMAQRSK